MLGLYVLIFFGVLYAVALILINKYYPEFFVHQDDDQGPPPYYPSF